MPKGDRELLKADIEDGYTKVSNLLLEALARARLSGVQKGICLYIIRRTYSWHKKSSKISLGEFAEGCGSEKTYVSKQLKDLVVMRVVSLDSVNLGGPSQYSINTRLYEWDEDCLNRQGLSKKTRVAQIDKSCLGEQESVVQEDKGGLSKETIAGPSEPSPDADSRTPKELFKKTIKKISNSIVEPIGSDTTILPAGNSKSKKTTKIFPAESEEYRLSILLRQCIINNDSGARAPAPTPEAMAKWCQDMDKLLRVDGRAPSEVERVITWCQQEQFWKAIILSAGKLREKFTTLNLQSERGVRGEPYSKATSIQHSGEDPALAIDLDRFLYQPK